MICDAHAFGIGAQRLAASMRSAHARTICVSAHAIVCSTPCGINEVGTHGHGAELRTCAVLNALRHQ